jgi:hypothetical protein
MAVRAPTAGHRLTVPWRDSVRRVSESTAQRYLELGLQLGRHDDGVVDAYFGPAELAAAVRDGPLAEPAELVAMAEALLDELDDGWLRDQVMGLRTFAGVLAGESVSYADEVEGCFGVRPTYTDESVFTAAHEALDELLPGTEPLAERLQRWRGSVVVPNERLEAVMTAVIEAARAETGELVDLPAGEGIVLELVRDQPWIAYNDYLGDLRGRISVNVDIPNSPIELLHLTLHETYPGHQAERSCKEELLVRGRGLVEETIVLSPTPQSLVSEGIAELAADLLLEGESGEALATVLHDMGIEFDLARAFAVERAAQPCRWVEVNTALLLHDAGASEAEAHAYLERWALISPTLADHAIRFMTEPTSRTYVVNYPAGKAVCGSYVAGDPVRFRRLLTEQVRVGDLVAARDKDTP